MPHFFISVTQYSLVISLSRFRLPKAAALTDRLQSVGICHSRTCVCIRSADLLIACLCR